MSNQKIWCPKPVSYVGDWSVSYIGDRSRAPKSFPNLGEGVELRVSGGHLTSKVDILGGYTNRKYHEVQLDQLKKFLNRYPNFRYPNPISYIRDWSWAPKNTGNYNIDNFWCQKPVSYIGCWSFSSIGDRSRALKSSANICYSNRI